MNMKFITAGTVTGLVLAGGIAGLVSAQTAANATGLTEEQVIEIALSEVAGDVTEVELENRKGQPVYEVEITSEDGTEMEVLIAAQDGEILKVKADDKDCDDKDKDNDDDENEDDDEDGDEA